MLNFRERFEPRLQREVAEIGDCHRVDVLEGVGFLGPQMVARTPRQQRDQREKKQKEAWTHTRNGQGRKMGDGMARGLRLGTLGFGGGFVRGFFRGGSRGGVRAFLRERRFRIRRGRVDDGVRELKGQRGFHILRRDAQAGSLLGAEGFCLQLGAHVVLARGGVDQGLHAPLGGGSLGGFGGVFLCFDGLGSVDSAEGVESVSGGFRLP